MTSPSPGIWDDDFEGYDVQFAAALATDEPGAAPLDALRELSFKSLCLQERKPDSAKMVLTIEELIAKTRALRARRRTQIAQLPRTSPLSLRSTGA